MSAAPAISAPVLFESSLSMAPATADIIYRVVNLVLSACALAVAALVVVEIEHRGPVAPRGLRERVLGPVCHAFQNTPAPAACASVPGMVAVT